MRPPTTVVSVRGTASLKLLQSLVTNDVTTWPRQSPLYAAFLTTKGRVLADSILFPGRDDSEVLLEVAASQRDAVLKHLKIYKLRADVKIEATNLVVAGDATEAIAGGPDPRLPDQLPARFVASAGEPPDDRGRFALGVATGHELANRIPLECNLDWLNSIAFNKGCYLGQELTARAKHRGAVRKRIVPLSIQNPVPEGTKVLADGHVVGEIVSSANDVALAMLRLDALHQPCQVDSQPALPCVPSWWPRDTDS